MDLTRADHEQPYRTTVHGTSRGDDQPRHEAVPLHVIDALRAKAAAQ
jgi:hypothetical protein